ncbi:nucleotidyl transferase AbiEii/AbiGii toxin family protein [Flavobacteriaceae bacterium F89]|uniref:Nucleotidyl transferase AbiEii/AbiGii toxin family protein n=1 Tax=Cerina litoralis TaxID=2874477 RepID=A0AAE3JUR5_9FLAO|nr:nucleotidyl transferase AbiEii/AbiGii toxin family protein [Cerina litoralis]MCG2462662.1 nucleotidyl transferase AbiEii/AbiGii toxin family protein [Cerina litoralis]
MNAVEESQRQLLLELMQTDFLSDHYLAGGTSLALRFGHRHSVVLDLFTYRDFDLSYSNMVNSKLKNKFRTNFTSISVTAVGVFGSIDNIKTDFVNFPHPLLKPLENHEGARLASLIDVAAMKINAVVGRGTQKDFYDIYELLNHFGLDEMLDAYQEKYQMDNTAMAERSLLYFEDAHDLKNRDNQVIILNGTQWAEVIERIRSAYQQLRNKRGRNGI